MKQTKVAVVDLDGQSVPPWVPEAVKREGIELLVHQCNSRSDLEEHAGDADIVWLFGGSRILQGGNLSALPRCRAILRTGSGTDNVPVEEATRRGIIVANTPAAFSDGVSDHAIALLMAVVRRIPTFDRGIRTGMFPPPYQGLLPLNSLQGRTLGLVGFGHAPRDLTRKLSGFAMKVLVHDPFVSPAVMAAHGAKAADLKSMLAEADFISLHCPLTAATRHLIGEAELRLMKPTAILINTARGPVVDEAAVVRALSEGWIAAAGLDVFEEEPFSPDNPLLKLDNVVLTPHVAGMSTNGVELRWRFSVDTIIALARGKPPPSWVNPEAKAIQSLSA